MSFDDLLSCEGERASESGLTLFFAEVTAEGSIGRLTPACWTGSLFGRDANADLTTEDEEEDEAEEENEEEEDDDEDEEEKETDDDDGDDDDDDDDEQKDLRSSSGLICTLSVRFV
jgi:hypothetical protein